jgi:hypothetical protein
MTDDTFQCRLGETVVETKADLWHNEYGRAVTLYLTAVLQVWADDDGRHVTGSLLGYFDTESWDVSKDGLMYTDRAVEDAVNAHLAELGLSRGAIWSEHGAQSAEFVDFDMSDALIAQLFPSVSNKEDDQD